MSNILTILPLFNPNGDDSVNSQQIIGGNPTGISNMNENRFPWTNALYRRMVANHWIPEKVSMTEDRVSITNLTDEEFVAVEDTLSFLIFLDSFQVLNLPNIANYITCPQIRNLLVIQQFQEVIHSQSYQYMLDSLFSLTSRENIYNRWRQNPNLLARIQFVTAVAQKFTDEPTEDNFKRVIIMNFILESIYFYQGFMFFDQLASREKLIQSSSMIDYIRTDEVTHIGIFTHIIKELFVASDYIMLKDMLAEAAIHEIEWAHSVYGDKILGISKTSSIEYIHYLVNHRLNMFKLPLLYSEQGLKNPYAHLDEKSRGNYFESSITEYDRADSINGWEDF